MKDFDYECRELWRMVYAAEIRRGGSSFSAESKADAAVDNYRRAWED